MLDTNKSSTEVAQVSCQNCGTEQAEDSQFCRKCGSRLATNATTSAAFETSPVLSSGSNQQSSTDVPKPPLPAAAKGEECNSRINLGTIVFASFSVLSLAVGLAKGIPLISIAETGVWAAAAIYWHQKNLSNPKDNLIVLLLAVCVAVGEGYFLGQSGSPSYTYLKEGDIQFRMDARRGRTDRLFGNGWRPVSFDRPPVAIPSDQIRRLVLSDGRWENETLSPPGQMCFYVQNDSDYVVKSVTIHPGVLGSNPPPISEPAVVLQSTYLVDKATAGQLCGTPLFHLSASDIWSYSETETSATGWKQ